MNKMYTPAFCPQSLTTERLYLKTLTVKEAPQVLDYFQRNRHFFQAWTPTTEDSFYTLAFQRKRLEAEKTAMEEKRLFRLWLYAQKDCSKIVGDIGFSNIVWGAFQSCHLGYKIDYQETHQGYMTEALQKAIDIIFQTFRLHRIEANILPKNVRSIRVVEKLGFVQEGLARKYLKINDIWEDHFHYVLLNPMVE